MRSSLLAILIFLSSFSFGQYVPDTETFSLQDVVTAVSPTTDDQVACFLEAIPEYYNPTYNNDLYAPISSLLRFRDYGAHNALGFETYVAPDDFDPDAQPVNIYEVFKDYYKINHDAKWIYSVTDATTKTKPTSGTSYYYGYELGGINYESNLASADTITWAVGATKKWVIANNTSIVPVYCNISNPAGGGVSNEGAEWLFLGNLVYGIYAHSCNELKYIHIDELTNITNYDNYCHLANNLTGTLHLSSSATNCGANAFGYFQYTITGTLIIPDTWTSIGNAAFERIQINELILGSNLQTINGGAFALCNQVNGEVIFPASLTSIGAFAFRGCTKLDSAIFNTGALTLGTSAFSGCTDLDIVEFAEGLTSIGDYCFQNDAQLDCPLTFPSTLTTIGYGAFLGCTGLNCTLTIPAGLTSIGEAAFGNTNFTAISESNTNYLVYDNVLYQLSPDTLALHSVKSATDSIEFLVNTELIGDYCCSNNLRTDTLVIPDNVTRVGDYAFYNCDGFNFLDLGTVNSNLTTIESNAFNSWGGISGKTLTIIPSITTINSHAFAYSPWQSLVLNEGLITIGDQCFGGLLQITSVNLTIPNTVKTIGGRAFFPSSFSGTLTLGDSLTSIQYDAFANCSFTGTLYIPPKVTYIAQAAFNYNYFDSIASGSPYFTVYDYVLYDGTVSGQIIATHSARNHTGTLTFKSGTTQIGNGCFISNTNRTGALSIPYTVTTIAINSFTNCTGFTSATIGDCTNGSSLATIGASAFAGCSNIASWEIYDPTAATCAAGSFGNYAKPLYVQTDATGYNVTPATVAAPWTNTAIFSAVNYTLCP